MNFKITLPTIILNFVYNLSVYRMLTQLIGISIMMQWYYVPGKVYGRKCRRRSFYAPKEITKEATLKEAMLQIK